MGIFSFLKPRVDPVAQYTTDVLEAMWAHDKWDMLFRRSTPVSVIDFFGAHEMFVNSIKGAKQTNIPANTLAGIWVDTLMTEYIRIDKERLAESRPRLSAWRDNDGRCAILDEEQLPRSPDGCPTITFIPTFIKEVQVPVNVWERRRSGDYMYKDHWNILRMDDGTWWFQNEDDNRCGTGASAEDCERQIDAK
jgi:hypothetical protein